MTAPQKLVYQSSYHVFLFLRIASQSVYHRDMHVFFSGIGGTAIGPLALIAKQAGYSVSGSDKQDSDYIDYLRSHGISSITIGQDEARIAAVHARTPIDWLVYSSAVAMENEDSPELAFCEAHGIRTSKRDEFLAEFLKQQNQQMIAIAGTHGKTTTTAMTVWTMQQLGLPLSYSVGAKLPFGPMGQFDPSARYFVYEADEYDKNFLAFHPVLSMITGIDWDHPDIYPTRESYYQAFQQFITQSSRTATWQQDAERLDLDAHDTITLLNEASDLGSTLTGKVNRQNAAVVAQALSRLLDDHTAQELTDILNAFPGVSRRFERISDSVYSDYAHTPEKIRGALQTAQEISEKVVVVYEGLHNTRQHFIRGELRWLFDGVKRLYIVPSYRAREDESLEDLTPEKLAQLIDSEIPVEPTQLDDTLRAHIQDHVKDGDLVLCLSAGGGGSLDEWLRREFA